MVCNTVPALALAFAYCLLLVLAAIICSVDGISSSDDKNMKTIKSVYGDIYDCVHIHKQPSLSHPLLKGHKIQMQPSFIQERRSQLSIKYTSLKKETTSKNVAKIGLGDQCPKGTVLIKRTSKEEQLNAESSFKAHFDILIDTGGTGFEFAGVSTIDRDGIKYRGGGGQVSIYNPHVDAGQFSASVISFEDGSMDEFSVVRFGWMVNNLYGDTQTRFYTIWGQGEDGKMHGCYNLYCPGFILLSRTTPLDHVFTNISVPGGPQNYIKLVVTQDKHSGNLYLFLAGSDSDRDEVIGYWPKALFRNFQGGAEVVRWGGMVYSDTGVSPPMGSGGEDCHFRNLWLKGEDIKVSLEKSKSRCYIVGGDSDQPDPVWVYSFWFGGVGGDIHSCHK